MTCFGKKDAYSNNKPSKSLPKKKILLLGAGDSGKSTIFKQLQRIYNNGFPEEEERVLMKNIIYENIFRNMMSLIKATQIFNENNRERALKIDQLSSSNFLSIERVWSSELGQEIKALWEDPGVQETFKKKSSFQIEDSAQYYFDNLDRICQNDYIPTEEDIVRARMKTSGFVEQKFHSHEFDFVMIDTPSNQRRALINHFKEGVDVVLFVTSMSEFDQKCYEDDQTNRMKESLQLFEDHINSRWFTGAQVYLLFNKYDLFEQKINSGIKLSDTFETYSGEKDVTLARNFIINMFTSKDINSKLVNVSCVTALDISELGKQIDSIVQSIISRSNPQASQTQI